MTFASSKSSVHYGAPRQQPGHSHEQPRPDPSDRPTVAALEARVRRYNSDIDPSSDTFRAAIILLAALDYGQNVDILSRRTGYDRAFVSRCARRLIDNGVWAGGRTVSDWSPEDEASGSFWNDVAVAEGKLCRRSVEGRIEWAPAGYWTKSYDFVDPATDAAVGTVYRDPAAPPPEEFPEPEPAREPAGAASPAAGEAPAGQPSGGESATPGQPTAQSGPEEDAVEAPSGEQKESTEAGPPEEPTAEPRRIAPPEELFPDAVWIR